MLRRILAIAKKESLHIRRDFRTLYLALVMPVIMILLFGYAIDFDIDHIALGICDQDNTVASRELSSRITAGGWFEIKRFTHDQLELESDLDTGYIKVALYIPEGFERNILRGETGVVAPVLDGSDNNAAQVGYNYLELFFALYRRELLESALQRAGLSLPGHVEISPRIYFNPELKSRYYILPGIIALTMAMMLALLTSITVAREWERGSMEQLIATPVRPHEIVLGKILPYIGIGLLQVTLAASFAVFVFHIPFEGSLLSLYGTSLLFAVGALGLGLLISAIMKSQLPAMQAALVASMLPSVLLSNFVFPIDSMPSLVRLVTYIVPARYFLVMLRTIFLKGSGMFAYVPEILFLFAYSTLVLVVTTKRLRKKIA